MVLRCARVIGNSCYAGYFHGNIFKYACPSHLAHLFSLLSSPCLHKPFHLIVYIDIKKPMLSLLDVIY